MLADTEAALQDQVLRQRAARLARVPADAAGGADGIEALAFTVAQQRCALDVSALCEVRPLQALLPVPLATGPLLGLAQLRGRVLPVLDLARLLDLDASRAPAPRLLVVLGERAPALVVAAGALHGLRWLRPENIQARSEPLQSVRPALVRGITEEGDWWLDAPRLLALQPASGR